MNALSFRGVGLVRDGRDILRAVDWDVDRGERWVVMGPNGSGKTTLVRIASLYLHPTTGQVEVLGAQLGRTDVRELRRRIGVTSAGLADVLRPGISALDVVMTAKFAALEPWWHEYEEGDRARAAELLDRLHVGHLHGRAFGSLSSGERQRVLLARTLMTEPELLLLDEPTAGLDVAGREELLESLSSLAADAREPPMVVVTHHLEEIPAHVTHLLLLRGGRVHASGALGEVLTSALVSECFGVDLVVTHRDGRWGAHKR